MAPDDLRATTTHAADADAVPDRVAIGTLVEIAGMRALLCWGPAGPRWHFADGSTCPAEFAAPTKYLDVVEA